MNRLFLTFQELHVVQSNQRSILSKGMGMSLFAPSASNVISLTPEKWMKSRNWLVVCCALHWPCRIQVSLCVALAYMYADIVRSTNNQSKYFEQCLLKRYERHYIESQTLQRTRMLSRGPLFARTKLCAHLLHCQIRCQCPSDVNDS